MNQRLFIAAVAAAALVAGGAGYLVSSGRLSGARASALDNIETYKRTLETVRGERDKRKALDVSIRSVADRTLGASSEATDSGLRSRLNRIGEEIGLADQAVSTDPDKERIPTPARSEFGANDKKLRDEPDFVEVHGSISGEGTLEQVMRLVHRIDVEPWIKRIEYLRLDPGKTGDRVKLQLKLTTIFIEGMAGQPVPPPSADAIGSFSKYVAFAQRNPFHLPAPPAPPPVVTHTPTGPPPFPWSQWKFTGRLDGPAGAEVCLRNVATKASTVLAPGAKLSDAEFVRFDEEDAVFKVGETLFKVELGATMDRRQPMAP